MMGPAMNVITEHWQLHHGGLHFHWQMPVNLTGLFAMAMADADGLWRFLLFHPHWSDPHRDVLAINRTLLCLIGLPGGLLMLWLLFRPSVKNEAVSLLRSVFGCAFAVFLVLLTVDPWVDYEARFICVIGILLIPAVVQSAVELWPGVAIWTRLLLLVGGLFYIAWPMAYGPAQVLGRVYLAAGYKTGPSHLYNPELSRMNAGAAIKALTADFSPDTDVWCLPEPVTGLDLPGRQIVGILDHDWGRGDKYRASRPVRMRLLLPASDDENGQAQRIKGAIVGAQDLRERTVDSANYVLWTVLCKPAN
jgi:hypothetical protein